MSHEEYRKQWKALQADKKAAWSAEDAAREKYLSNRTAENKKAWDRAMKIRESVSNKFDKLNERYRKQPGAWAAIFEEQRELRKKANGGQPREITSSTYKRAMKRQDKEVEAWFGIDRRKW